MTHRLHGPVSNSPTGSAPTGYAAVDWSLFFTINHPFRALNLLNFTLSPLGYLVSVVPWWVDDTRDVAMNYHTMDVVQVYGGPQRDFNDD